MPKGLGRGLDALFGDAPEIEDNARQTVRLVDIEPNAGQPRRNFDRESLDALAESIKTHGLLQPIVVRRAEGGVYRIIAGERRWRAARIAGLTEAPVTILDIDDRKAAELTLVENLQREDLRPLEEAAGYETLISAFGLTQEETALRVGKSRPAVANALRLLTLPEKIRDIVERGELTAGHARALLGLRDEKTQLETAQLCVRKEMSVRELEAHIRRLLRPKVEVLPSAFTVDYAAEVSRRLSESLGRRTTLRPGSKKGKIEIEYYGNDDLETLIERLTQNLQSGDPPPA